MDVNDAVHTTTITTTTVTKDIWDHFQIFSSCMNGRQPMKIHPNAQGFMLKMSIYRTLSLISVDAHPGEKKTAQARF